MGPAEAILRQLICEYGAALQLTVEYNHIAAHISEQTKLAQGTVLGIVVGYGLVCHHHASNLIRNYIK
jgi:hypothetical protein